MRLVITGGAGFIGSNLAEELSKKYEVTVIDNLSTGRIENLDQINDKISFIRGSITDLELLRESFADADTVFHQAAIPSVQRSVDNPIASNEANIDGTLNVLVAAKECNVRKVVYASSSSAYGDTPTLPKREDMKPNPRSPYAVSKLAGEYYCRVFSDVYGLKTACLRYFNVYGPRQNPESQYAAVIPRFVTRILAHKPPVIYGDGKQTRDFTFVKDVVKANILAMESEAEGVFNIACGKRISLNELAGKIMEITGIRVDPIYDAPRQGDVRDSLADISDARRELGYEPSFDLDSGLEGTIKWFSGELE
ncbi:L-arabinose 1-dehydrogenase (NAD(P)(+)) [uncultured archaeon]|nr:L-arabinose 1-dehydrogenase (NAD(P)(+)) [uncultured archaeon]